MNAVLLGALEQANRSGDEILAFAGGFDGLLADEIELVSALRGAAPPRGRICERGGPGARPRAP